MLYFHLTNLATSTPKDKHIVWINDFNKALHASTPGQKHAEAHRHYIKKKSVSLELREKRFAVWALEQINSRMAVQGDQARGQGWREETYNVRSPLPACPSSPSPLPSLWGTKVSTDNRHYVLAPILTTM